MALREDIVASATQFLQDPSVAASSLENRIAFLRSKHLTQEEIDASLSRAGQNPFTQVQHHHPQPVHQPHQNGGPHSPQYPPYGWQSSLAQETRRDWRDWFIMATVVGGVGFGLYELGKRYVYPLIAPPTPERLERDKKDIDEQFDRAFALFEQLSKDTSALKAAETDRTTRLDVALTELDSVLSELKSTNIRREDESRRIRADIGALQELIPRALASQKEGTDARIRELIGELSSLKALTNPRVPGPSTSGPTAFAPSAPPTVSGPTAPPSLSGLPAASNSSSLPSALNGETLRQMRNSIAHPGMSHGAPRSTTAASENGADDSPTPVGFGGLTRSSTFAPSAGKSIPSWQLAMKHSSSAASVSGAETHSTS
jgi:peroxin-14